MCFKGKKVIVTGSSRGIGFSLVRRFAEEGCIVYACSRNEENGYLKEIEKIAHSCGTSIIPVTFDLQDKDSLKNSIKEITKNNRVDILVNNAGITDAGLFLMTSIDSIREMFEVNFFSALEIMQLVGKSMLRNKKGNIINICSVSGIEREKGRLSYGSSKAALLFASKVLAVELADYSIRVNTVSPGFIDTDMWRTRDKELYERVLNETPLKKQGSTNDVVNAVMFLASEASQFITGQNIVVDGGRMH